jgi:hypothetical protein
VKLGKVNSLGRMPFDFLMKMKRRGNSLLTGAATRLSNEGVSATAPAPNADVFRNLLLLVAMASPLLICDT